MRAKHVGKAGNWSLSCNVLEAQQAATMEADCDRLAEIARRCGFEQVTACLAGFHGQPDDGN